MRIAFQTSQPAPNATADCSVDIPALGPAHVETLPVQGQFVPARGSFRCYAGRDSSAYVAKVPVDGPSTRPASHALYAELFELIGPRQLYRVWNYLPQINEGENDQERYRQFCLGRSQAFEQRFGSGGFQSMPAGTCVGSDGSELVVIALASDAPPAHHENPKQIPAYRYPRAYGPRSPSFARASSVAIASRRHRFLSGTASILGHESVGIGDLPRQLAVTCDNLEAIAQETLEADPNADRPQLPVHCAGKVYLRHAEHYPAAQAFLHKRFPQWSPELVYLRSDICRRELLVEIELSFLDSP